MSMSRPQHVNPLQWNEAVAVARQGCARVFRNGGTPKDAFASFGLKTELAPPTLDWAKTVETIAGTLCQAQRRAA